MSKKLLKIVLFVLVFYLVGIGIGAFKVNLVLAQNIDDSAIVYPIKELGNCADKGACKKYCDIKANQSSCLDFAQSRGMMPKQDIDQAKKMLKLAEEGTNTPGGCQGQEACNAYCADRAHLDECVAFGAKAGLISPEEVKMIKKTGGKGPGNCQGKKACDAYCENEANLDECISFAEKNGLMTAQEKDMIKKTGGKGPGGCKSKESCDAYCQQEVNFDTCLEFGRQNGIMSEEEYAMAKKMGPKMMMQGGPGGCKDKEQCDTFCGDEKNFDACIDFGKQNGLMNEEEYQMAKKMGPKMMMQGGPGGCKGKDECKSLCDNPANGEECVKFAISSGMMSEEEAAKMKERGYMAPPKGALGDNGEFMGPGGCKSQEECTAFCSEAANNDVCSMFGAGLPPGQGGDIPAMPGTESNRQSGGQPGPGGCDSPTACMKFCSDSANQETCARFTVPPSPGSEPGDPNQQQMPSGNFQVPRRGDGQQQPSQSGANEPGQGMSLPGEQRERMEPGQPEFGAPPPEVQFNQLNNLNPAMPLQEGQLIQPPVGEPGQAPPEFQTGPAPQIESVPAVQQAPPAEFQAPAPVAPPPSEPAPQASNEEGFISSMFNLLSSVASAILNK